MKLLLRFCLLTLPVAASLLAQEPDPTSFFPHHVGDTWTYRYYHGEIWTKKVHDVRISGDTTYIDFGTSAAALFINNNDVYFPLTKFTLLEYRLTAQKGESWTVRPADSTGYGRIDAVVNVYPSVLFGRPTTIMEIGYFKLLNGEDSISSNSLYEYTDWLASGIGLVQELGEGSSEPEFVLTGCVINGDTLGLLTDVTDNVSTDNDLQLSIFPNPSSSMTVVRFTLPPGTNEASVTLYDMLGHTVYAQKTSDPTVRLDVSALPDGMYFCTVNTGGLTQAQKLVVHR